MKSLRSRYPSCNSIGIQSFSQTSITHTRTYHKLSHGSISHLDNPLGRPSSFCTSFFLPGPRPGTVGCSLKRSQDRDYEWERTSRILEVLHRFQDGKMLFDWLRYLRSCEALKHEASLDQHQGVPYMLWLRGFRTMHGMHCSLPWPMR